jgi:outer membrane protein OmpA-like peptidoglycan-associated protein
MKKMLLVTLLLVVVVGKLLAQRNGKVLNDSQWLQQINIVNATAVNTPSIEFSPAFYRNGIVFVSSRIKSGPIDEKLGETFFELFYADLDPNGLPIKPLPFSMELNSRFHEGPVAFNKKGNRIYFTRTNMHLGIAQSDKKGKKGKVHLKIYEAVRGEYDWENVTELPFNSDKYSCMHPTLSPDGTRMFFSSDMPGGYGGRDLYVVEKQGNTWSKPINLGPDINTNKDEAFPFFHESGVLFFASDGHPGFGGLDIFMIDMSSRIWGVVTNLGKTINSAHDDLGFILNEEGTRGYFSSNRQGGLGKDDIYMFELPNGLPGIEVKNRVNVVVAVYDASNSRGAAGAAVRVFERGEDGLLENENLYNVELTPSPNNRPNDYVFTLVRKKEDELGEPRQYTGRNGEAIISVEEDKEYIILISKSGYTTHEVKYATKYGAIPRPIEVALKPSNCITLTGTAMNNQTSKRIPGVRIRVRNECTGQEESLQTNVDGFFEYCLEMGCDFTIQAEKTGYTRASTEVSTVRIRGSRSQEIQLDMIPVSDVANREPIQQGTVILLENIYYDFNKSVIRTGEDRELEALAHLMNLYPSMEIELAAHTDSRGDEASNLLLSLRRAESAKDFLVSRGVLPHRIKAVGYGEARLRNHCRDGVECSEEEHQYNRRTEVIVTRMEESVPIEYNQRSNNNLPRRKN